jgi:hypothetical protein
MGCTLQNLHVKVGKYRKGGTLCESCTMADEILRPHLEQNHVEVVGTFREVELAM